MTGESSAACGTSGKRRLRAHGHSPYLHLLALALALTISCDDDVDGVPDASVSIVDCTVDGWCQHVVPDGVNVDRFTNLSGLTESSVWAATGEPRLLHYDGAVWTVMDAPVDVVGVLPITQNIVYAFGSGGIYRWDGATWTDSGLHPGVEFREGWAANMSDVHIVGPGHIAHYDGTEWTFSYTGSADLNAIWGRNAADIYAAGNAGAVLHYDGKTWSPIDRGVPNVDFTDVFGYSDDVYLVGDPAGLHHFDGTTWTIEPLPATGLIRGWATYTDVRWLGGTDGTVLHDPGTGWFPQTTGVTGDITGIWGNAAIRWLVTNTGELRIQSDRE